MSCFTALYAQSQTVTGKVTSQNGEVQLFATAQVKCTQVITTADAQCVYIIKAKNGDILVFAGTSFVKREVMGNASVMDVTVTSQVSSLNEIVVTGYGKRSKRSATGESSIISVNDVRIQPIASFDQLLQGQAAGLLKLRNSGKPGVPAAIVIRERGNITGLSNSLYILDGIKITAADLYGLIKRF